MNRILSLKDHYSAKESLAYNPGKNVPGFRIRDKFVAFDDRFMRVSDEINDQVRGRSKKKLNLLDIGVGDGVYESLLSEQTSERIDVYGIDISSEQLVRSKKYLKEGKIVDLNSQNIPYKNNFFDIVVISEILEHIFYPDKAIKESLRVLKPGGVLIMTFPNSSSLQMRISIFFLGSSPQLNYPANKEHIRFFNKKDILGLLGKDIGVIKHIGLGSLLFSKWNFPVRIIMPRFLQILANYTFPDLALGSMLVLKKNET